MSTTREFAGTVALMLLMAAPAVASAQATARAPQKAASTASSDDTLEDRIDFRLETAPTLKKYDIDVDVKAGVAALSGNVSTEAQKAEAARLAQVAGVTRVDNQIRVHPDADKGAADRIKSGLSKTGEKIDDAWITTKVNWFFVGEDALKGSHINVDTKQNVVTLKGTVPNAAARARAKELAAGAEGVKTVVDEMTIAAR